MTVVNNPYQLVDTFIDHWAGLPRDTGALMPHVRTFLDKAEPKLQPHVALVDIHSRDDWTLKLYGTGRVNAFGKDLSGINPLEVYAPEIQPLLMDSIQHVINQPCGWKSSRKVTTVRGLENHGSGVTLPMATDDNNTKCVVNFMIFNEPIAHNDRQGVVDNITSWEWMDIGAGIPES